MGGTRRIGLQTCQLLRGRRSETVNFGVLALIVLAGLAGPLLGVGRGVFVPVVIGEVLAGVVIGRTGLDAVDLTDPTVQFLGDVSFAMSRPHSSAVPAAVVSLGLQEKVLTAAQGAAIITAALASLGIAALGTTLLAREARQVGDDAASETTAVAERA